MKQTIKLAFLVLIPLISTQVIIGQRQSLPPGLIAFVREQTGATDPTQQISNLLLMDVQSPGSPTALTQFTTQTVFVSQPAWSKDFSQIAFSSNFNLPFSGEDESVFSIAPNGTNLRQITGFGVVGRAPGGTGNVRGTVAFQAVAPSSAIVSAQGMDRIAFANSNGAYELLGVPTSSIFVRAEALINTLPGGQSGPGRVLGFETVRVTANQTTDVPRIDLVPQFSRSSTPSWSRDARRLIVTRTVSSKRQQGGRWEDVPPSPSLQVWNADGTLGTPIQNAQFQLWGADWSPTSDKLVFVATGAGAGESFVVITNGEGSNPQTIYQVPFDFFVTHLILRCFWSPDGRQIAFSQLALSSFPSGWSDLFLINADGSGLRQLTSNSSGRFVENGAWSPDGRALAFEIAEGDLVRIVRSNIFTVFANGTGLRQLTSDGRSGQPAWGRRSFLSDESDEALSTAATDKAIREIEQITRLNPPRAMTASESNWLNPWIRHGLSRYGRERVPLMPNTLIWLKQRRADHEKPFCNHFSDNHVLGVHFTER